MYYVGYRYLSLLSIDFPRVYNYCVYYMFYLFFIVDMQKVFKICWNFSIQHAIDGYTTFEVWRKWLEGVNP